MANLKMRPMTEEEKRSGVSTEPKRANLKMTYVGDAELKPTLGAAEARQNAPIITPDAATPIKWGRLLGASADKGSSSFFESAFNTMVKLNPLSKFEWNTPAELALQAVRAEKQREEEIVQEELAKGGKGAEIVSNLTSMTAQAAPTAIMALASAPLKGTQLAVDAVTKAAPVAMSTLKTVAQNTASNPLFYSSLMQSVGNDYDYAKANGANDVAASLYAVGAGALGAALETSGGIETLPDELPKSKNALLSWAKSAVDEGKEEVAQGIISRSLDKMLVTQSNPLVGISNEKAVINPKTMAEEFGYGTAVGGILGGGQLLADVMLNRQKNPLTPAQGNAPQATTDAPEINAPQIAENAPQTMPTQEVQKPTTQQFDAENYKNKSVFSSYVGKPFDQVHKLLREIIRQMYDIKGNLVMSGELGDYSWYYSGNQRGYIVSNKITGETFSTGATRKGANARDLVDAIEKDAAKNIMLASGEASRIFEDSDFNTHLSLWDMMEAYNSAKNLGGKQSAEEYLRDLEYREHRTDSDGNLLASNANAKFERKLFERMTAQPAETVEQNDGVGARNNQYKSGQAVSKAKSPWEAGQEVSQEERLYDVTSDEERLAVARQRLDLDYEGEAKYLRETNEWNGEDINVAHMIQSDLFAEAQKTGDFKEFRDWQKMVKRHSSNFGANLQMLKHWAKRNAESVTSDAAAILEEAKEAAAASGGKKIISEEMLDAALGDIAFYGARAEALEKAGDMEGIYDLVIDAAKHRGYNPSKAVRNALKTCTMEELQDVMWAEINGIAIDAIPSSLGRKISTYQYLAQLLNAKTLLRNITSNSILAPVESVFTNNIAAVVDMVTSYVVSANQGITTQQARTVGFESPFSAEKRAGRKRGIQQSAIDVSLDINRGDGANKYEVNTNRTFNRYAGGGFWNAVRNIPNTLEGALGYGLNVTDEMQKGATDASVRKSLAKLAGTEGSRITQEMVDDFAKNEQLYRSVQRETAVGQLLQKFKDAANVIGIGKSNGKTIRIAGKTFTVKDFGLGDFINKYSKVPGAIATTLVEYTDLGMAKAIYNLYAMAEANYQIYSGRADSKSGVDGYKEMTNRQASVYAQRAFAQNIARVLTGKGIVAAFTGLAKLGVLVFTDDEDKDEAAVKRSQGLSGLQINLSALGRLLDGESAEKQHDDVLIDINSIEPINGLAQIGAELAAMEDDATRAEKFNATAQAVVDSFTDLSMMQNVGTIVDNFTYRGDEETWGETITKSGLGLLTNSVSGLVPAPVRQAAQFADPYYRDAYSGTEQERLANAVKNPIPGLRQQLPTSITPLGEERKKTTSGALDFFTSFISPFNITRYQQSDVVDEMERSGVYVSRSSPKTLTKDGVETELTAEQRRQHQISKGSAINMAVSGLMGSASFKNASEKDRNEMMADARSYANEVAKASVVGDKAADGWVIRARDSGMPEAYIQYRHFANGSSQADVAKALQKVQGISDQQRGKIWSAEKNQDGKESTEAKNPFTGAMPQAGISSSTAVDILAEYSKIDKSDLKDRDKPAEFRKYVRTLGLDPKQMRVVGNIFPYFGSYPIYW